MEYIEYNIEDYPFRKIIEEVLQTKDLERIHSMADYDLFVKGTDQSTIWHKRYYDNLDKGIHLKSTLTLVLEVVFCLLPCIRLLPFHLTT